MFFIFNFHNKLFEYCAQRPAAKQRWLERTRGSQCAVGQAGIPAQRFSRCYMKSHRLNNNQSAEATDGAG